MISSLLQRSSSLVARMHSTVFCHTVRSLPLDNRMTCIVIVLPPLTTSPEDRFCHAALTRDTGLTPGCHRNQRSSKAVIAVVNFSGTVSDGGNLHCPSSAILAFRSSPLRSVMTVEYAVPSKSSRGRQHRYAIATMTRPAMTVVIAGCFLIWPEKVDPKGGLSRLAKMRKPECTGVHEDFRSQRNAESTLLGRPFEKYFCIVFCMPCRERSLFYRSLSRCGTGIGFRGIHGFTVYGRQGESPLVCSPEPYGECFSCPFREVEIIYYPVITDVHIVVVLPHGCRPGSVHPFIEDFPA